MFNGKRKEQLIHLCQRLVQQKSYSGEEASVAMVIKEFAQEALFDEIVTDKFGNLILSITGSRDGPKVLFDAHMDTVPITEKKWSFDPFAAEIREGRIYGRGTSDMKGSLSAMLAAATYFAQDTNKEFPGVIYISCSVHEECFEGVATREVSKIVNPDYVVIGEATNLNLNRGQRGRAEIVIETFGKSAHSSNPIIGVNAVLKMMTILHRIAGLQEGQNDVLGKGILEITDIKSSPYPGASVVPSYCKVTYDRRLLIGETKESVLAPLCAIVDQLRKEDSQLEATVSIAIDQKQCYTGETIGGERFFPAWLFDEQKPFVQTALHSLRRHGLKSELSHYSFCTNGSHFAGERGINTLGFGPSQEFLAHIDNEYIEIEQLEKASVGYYALMEGLSNIQSY